MHSPLRGFFAMATSLLFLIPLALLWLLFVRPQQRRMRQAQAMVATLAVGDEIITSGGLYGTVTDTDDTSLWVEIAPDVVVRVMRAAVAQQVTPTDLDEDDDDDDDTDYDAEDTDTDVDDATADASATTALNGAVQDPSPVDDDA
ncbi:MAG TPA: preprotein translocase subunit YajC [Acidimicrobiales bacterium]|nr:preprotein translocase subunit YajC [Acidimicrobiales bacterium]